MIVAGEALPGLGRWELLPPAVSLQIQLCERKPNLKTLWGRTRRRLSARRRHAWRRCSVIAVGLYRRYPHVVEAPRGGARASRDVAPRL